MLSKTGAAVKSDAEETGMIRLCIRGRMADQLRALARDSGASSVSKWCEMALETYVVDHRSGKRYEASPEHHTALQAWDVVA